MADHGPDDGPDDGPDRAAGRVSGRAPDPGLVPPHRPDRAAAHRELAEWWFGRAWAGGDTSIAEDVFAEHFVLNGRTVGPAGPRRSVAAVHGAFSDVGVVLDLVLTDGPHMVTHYTTTARHTGTFRGVPASGRSIRATGIVIWEIADGKVVRDWNTFDTAGLVAQITGGERHGEAGGSRGGDPT